MTKREVISSKVWNLSAFLLLHLTSAQWSTSFHAYLQPPKESRKIWFAVEYVVVYCLDSRLNYCIFTIHNSRTAHQVVDVTLKAGLRLRNGMLNDFQFHTSLYTTALWHTLTLIDTMKIILSSKKITQHRTRWSFNDADGKVGHCSSKEQYWRKYNSYNTVKIGEKITSDLYHH